MFAAIIILIVVFLGLLAFSSYFNLLRFLLIWLPLQTMICMIIFSYTGSADIVKPFLALKEICLLLSFFCVIFNWNKISFIACDYFAVLSIIYVSIYALIPDSFLGVECSIESRLYGFRSAIIPFLLYFLGRFSNFNEHQVLKIFKFQFGVALLVSLFGFFEYSVPWEFWRDNLLYQEFREMQAVGVSQGVFDGGVKQYFYTAFSGSELRRLVSTFSSPLHVAFYLAFPIIFLISLYLTKLKLIFKENFYSFLIFLIFLFAFILTFSRGPFISLALSIIVLVFNFGANSRKLKTILYSIFFISILVVFFYSDITNIVSSTVSLSDPSSQGHFAAYEKAFDVIPEHPLGIGLGQSGSVGAAFGNGGGLGESLYFTILSEQGYLGFIIFVFFVSNLLFHLKRKTIFTSHDFNVSLLRHLNISIFSLTFFYIFASMNTEQWRGFTMSGFYWLFLGFLLTLNSNRNRGMPIEKLT